MPLDAVAFSGHVPPAGIHRVLVQPDLTAAPLQSLCMHTGMLQTALGRVGALLPQLLVGQQSSPAHAVARMRQAGEGNGIPLIHGGTTPHPAEAHPR